MEKIFLIGVVCVILISIAVVDARKKKIPNILLGILFFCAVLSGFMLSGDIVAGSNCGRDSGQRSVFDRDMDSTGSIWGR